MLTLKNWRTPENFLLVIAFTMPLTFSVWHALLNNFVIEFAAFTGKEIGILQSIREVPGFLAFSVVFLLLIFVEQSLAIVALMLMCLGVMMTGFWPETIPLYFTTLLMSTGFHYLETINQSLTLQWLDKKKSAAFLGKVLSIKSIAALLAYGGIWLLMEQLSMDYLMMYVLAGGIGFALALLIWITFPRFEQKEAQHKKIILRSKYWLYYALTFFSGARRQIFVVFAGFMMVEKFGYSVGDISLLFLLNYGINMLFGQAIGRWIGRVGERKALTFEYIGLFVVFTGYAFVESASMAAALYVIDHLFFALAIATKTYFQKIADPKDIASSAGVSFTINHIAAVFIPVLLGLIWLESPTFVFMVGSGFAFCSLVLAQLIPETPTQGYETLWKRHKSSIENSGSM